MSGALEPRESHGSRWETAGWIALLLAAAWTRLWQLGARVMTHDESIHAFHSLELVRNGVYRHDPAFHGPLLYHLNSVVFFLFGASDFTARVAPALTGVALIGSLWLFRRWMGRAGALLAATLVTFSPTLLFYSRHARNDIYIAFFTLLWVYAILRYLEEPRRRWLYLLATAMALAFATKEVSFIHGAVAGLFVAFVALRPGSPPERNRRRRAAGDLAVLMLTLVLPFASGSLYVMLGWDFQVWEMSMAALKRLVLIGGGLFILGAAGAVSWCWTGRNHAGLFMGSGDWARMASLFWGLQVVLFTTFFTHLPGLVSGVAGSLGYWLQQQSVARGSQPWFYYPMLAALYEFLPAMVCLVFIPWLWTRWRRHDRNLLPETALPVGSNAGEPADRHGFLAFLIWWALAGSLAYTMAGEKMPWLLTHMILPLCMLAGTGLACFLRRDWRRAGTGTSLLLSGGTVVLILAAVSLAGMTPFQGRDIEAVAESAGWWARVVCVAALAVLMGRAMLRVGVVAGLRRCALGVVVLSFLLTLRTTVLLNYVNYDLPTEPLSYAQGSPDVKHVLDEIARLARRSSRRQDLEIAYTPECAWPFAWYLREYPGARAWSEGQGASPAVILAGPGDRDMWPDVTGGYARSSHILIWWPVQDYVDLTAAEIWRSFGRREVRERLWQIFLHRRDPGLDFDRWPARRSFEMFVRNDLHEYGGQLGELAAGSAGTPPVSFETLAWRPDAFHSGPYAGLPLTGPADVAVRDDGSWIVADTGNHRVLVLEQDGALRFVIGGARCAFSEPGREGCVDPDGNGPLEPGDGQFNEPWGVASGEDGEIVVADTWNGRIQVFGPQGHFRRKWGRFSTSRQDTRGGEPALYGPRDVEVDPAGNLLVADTGNKRLLMFGSTGEEIRSIGAGGTGVEALDEPVGLAWDGNRTLLVADAWNGRIKRLDSRQNTIAMWSVPAWRGRGATEKPYLDVDANGRVYASDPAGGRVLVFTPAGRLQAGFRLRETGHSSARPMGLAVDENSERLLVVDHAGGRLLVYSLDWPSS